MEGERRRVESRELISGETEGDGDALMSLSHEVRTMRIDFWADMVEEESGVMKGDGLRFEGVRDDGWLGSS